MNMDQSSAEQWVKGMQDLFYGVNPLKVPVLYEHDQAAVWIPFGRPPSQISYDTITLRYAVILAAGYGLTLSDIGFPTSSNGGETLAGTIRMERVGKSSGKSNAKKKWESYAARILPETLKFMWIDYDDERNVSKGRARLASAQASNIWVTNRQFLPSEMRRQAIADGLVSIDVPEEIDENDPEFASLQQPQFGGGKAKQLGAKTNPSQGGQGEVIPQQVVQKASSAAEVGLAKVAYSTNEILNSLLSQVQRNLSPEEVGLWEEYVDGYLIGKSEIEEEELKKVLDDIRGRAISIVKSQPWIEDISKAIQDAVIVSITKKEVAEASVRLSQQAEEEFIAGKRESPEPTDSPVVDVLFHSQDLYGVIKESFTTLVASYCILVAKSHLLSGKLNVDSTELVSENIRVSREVSKDVLQSLSRIIHSVYEDGSEYLQKRIKGNG
jgi:hypothetical protein